jgi:nucleotide-binding universal stress UspA family protein
MKNILVAIDFGEASKRALDEARTLAASFGSSLDLLCIVQDPFAFPWAPAAPHEELLSLLKPMQREAGEHLKRLLTPDEALTYHANLVTRVGKPAEQILAYAREHAVNLIVMGRDGHGSPTAAASLGSVAQAVARQAPCPVLLVPATHD